MPLSILFAAAFFVIFGLLARMSPCNPGQPSFLLKELPDDVIYFLITVVAYSGLSIAVLKLAFSAAFAEQAPRVLATVQAGYGLLPHLPLLVQALVMVLLVDVIQYWLHRTFHHRLLWPFHAVHHSARQVNWTTTYRVHPVNFVLYNTSAAVLTLALGFSPVVFAIVAPFNLVTAALVHANLNWTFGPFRYVLASPVFHRWHHSSDPAVRDKNFAPTFPFLDLMFGTFYMPEGQLPDSYGAEGVPDHFLGQLIYPFRPFVDGLGRLGKPAGPPAVAEH